MKRYNAPNGSRFARFGIRSPHELSSFRSYRGGTRL